MILTENCTNHVKNSNINFINIFQKNIGEENTCWFISEFSIILLPNPYEILQKNSLQFYIFYNYNCRHEDSLHISKHIQQHTKNIIHHTQMWFVPGMKSWISIIETAHFNNIYMIISVNEENRFDEVQEAFKLLNN